MEPERRVDLVSSLCGRLTQYLVWDIRNREGFRMPQIHWRKGRGQPSRLDSSEPESSRGARLGLRTAGLNAPGSGSAGSRIGPETVMLGASACGSDLLGGRLLEAVLRPPALRVPSGVERDADAALCARGHDQRHAHRQQRCAPGDAAAAGRAAGSGSQATRCARGDSARAARGGTRSERKKGHKQGENRKSAPLRNTLTADFDPRTTTRGASGNVRI